MSDLQTLKGVFRWQAAFCRKSGSPISALVMERLSDDINAAPPYGLLLAPWLDSSSEAVFADAVAMRMLGAFHSLVLSHQAQTLASIYASDPEAIDPRELSAALTRAASDHMEVMASFLASPPQTNEVARCLALVGGFLTVAQETRLPLRCLELGASAGLNMNWDRFGYAFGGGARWGDGRSPVQLCGDWDGANPPLPSVHVAERAACDQNPIDVTDMSEALKLQSFVWVGQSLRLERIRAAIAVKRETGGVPDRADAADWAQAHVHPKAGVATVVYHSVFLQYPPEPIQRRIVAAIEAAGAAATPDAPVAWLSMEIDPKATAGPMEVLLTQWPGGARRLLAHAHPHGATVRWRA